MCLLTCDKVVVGGKTPGVDGKASADEGNIHLGPRAHQHRGSTIATKHPDVTRHSANEYADRHGVHFFASAEGE